jgi:hypothetical protein
MSNRSLPRTIAALLILSAVYGAPMRAIAQDILIQNVTLISPERVAPMLHADLLLQNGKISRIDTKLVPGPQSQRIDGERIYFYSNTTRSMIFQRMTR